MFRLNADAHEPRPDPGDSDLASRRGRGDRPQTIVATSGDTNNNYDILLDADAGGCSDDGNA